MLRLSGIDCHYGGVQALHGLSLELAGGEVHCLLGRNGAGKSTTLKAIIGQVPVSAGSISLDGEELTRLAPHRIPRLGIGYVPQGRRLFSELTVAENIQIGLMTRGRGRAVRDQVLALFPVLAERLEQSAGTLSGGEQQQLAMARALCLEPRVLLLDEPTEGLQPSMIQLIRRTVAELRDRGVGVLLVEQRVEAVLSLADRVTFVESGRSRQTVDAAGLAADPHLIDRYVGLAAERGDHGSSGKH